MARAVVEAGIRGMSRPCIRTHAVAGVRAALMGVTAGGLSLVARDRLRVTGPMILPERGCDLGDRLPLLAALFRSRVGDVGDLPAMRGLIGDVVRVRQVEAKMPRYVGDGILRRIRQDVRGGEPAGEREGGRQPEDGHSPTGEHSPVLPPTGSGGDDARFGFRQAGAQPLPTELGVRRRLPPLEIFLQTSVHRSSRISLSVPRARHCIALIAPLLFPRAEATSAFLIPARYFSSTTRLCSSGSRSMAAANVNRSSTVQPLVRSGSSSRGMTRRRLATSSSTTCLAMPNSQATNGAPVSRYRGRAAHARRNVSATASSAPSPRSPRCRRAILKMRAWWSR